ncbi:hypothetical protein [Oryzihumus leptocrescens]|uniref:Uncharacterized protein n=1 Tax=Oryzihumus leptocrescens TaxID=297536 RepID=A0A542ZF76_9MICO|nr:hypothetical protein [Oryzihumus leptocrescens]TQL58961.1 hypothetical protein FB474_0304 [Oryzihumus leptocrescens]
MTPGPEVSERAKTQGTRALLVVGVIAAVLGAAWWGFDADPRQGKVILVLGVAAVTAGRVLSGRLSSSGQRALLVIVAVLAVLTLLGAVHLVQVVNYQRASHNQ